MRKKALFSLLLVYLISFTTACNSSTKSKSPLASMHRDSMELMLSANLSDFQQKVLEDLWITDSEWNDATSRYAECIADLGWEPLIGERQFSFGITQETQNILFKDAKTPEEIEPILSLIDTETHNCAKGNIYPIGMAYFEPRNNPDGVDDIEALRRCYAFRGLTELEGMTNIEIEETIRSEDYDVRNPPERALCIENPGYTDW